MAKQANITDDLEELNFLIGYTNHQAALLRGEDDLDTAAIYSDCERHLLTLQAILRNRGTDMDGKEVPSEALSEPDNVSHRMQNLQDHQAYEKFMREQDNVE